MAFEAGVNQKGLACPAKESNALLAFLAGKGRKLSPLLILTHDQPDPDSIASAHALSYLAANICGVRGRLVYGGLIGRIENREMVRLLKIPLFPVDERDLAWRGCTALVDTQPPFRNNAYPSRRRPSIIIDHHHRNKQTQAEFLLIDEGYGSTCTILAEAIFAAGLEVPQRLATALVYGIGSETQNLGRAAGKRDISVYLRLFSLSNVKVLSSIQNPPRPISFFTILHQALQKAFICEDVVGVHLNGISSPEVVAEVADFLLSYEKARWSICTGRYCGRLFTSLRARNPKAEAGRLLNKLLGGRNRAGGHGMIAGGSIGIGEGADEGQWKSAEERIRTSFLKRLDISEMSQMEYPFGKDYVKGDVV